MNPTAPAPDLILHNGRITTLDPKRPEAKNLAVKDGRIVGVDACPMEGFVPAEFDKVLGLPAQGYAAVVCCALGYRSADDKYATAPKVRFPARELIQTI